GMKGIRLLFAVLLVPLAFQAAFADDETDVSRAATRRGTTTTVTSNRQKPNTEQKSTTTQSQTSSRVININKTPESGAVRERSTTKQVSNRSGNVVNNTNRGTVTPQQNKSVTARTGTVVQSRNAPTTSSPRITTRNSGANRATMSRAGTISRAALSNITTGRTTSRNRNARVSRAATNTDEIVASITSRNFSACRDIFFECMDEFCANKDSTLKRCACSARIHDFDKTKEQLTQVEDKLLDFSQRLLTVSMDKEDAMALNTATEGEIAYATDDTSKSKKMLDEIAKKLNASFNNSNFDQGLNAISLSLNTDAAFDSVDSMMGASTTTKSGTALYNAALPICREMAMEICTESDLEIAESGYQMAIAQDCNTVQKAYETQNDQARAKIKESAALLDMSRLNIHQERNSDDILTCKSKMLEMLTDTTVCGADMSKCLDISGKYIDPTTGQAFLTEDLSELQNLIKRPAPDQTWTATQENREFVLFLESKKIYLEPAMEKCQDISTYVWDEFIEDALAQIKLAQDAKLQQVSQSCTTLTTQCLDNANKTITDFDARALSIFGVKADVTVNAMCSDIKNMCTTLMAAISTPGEKTDWESGMDEIATDKSYETILSTCREVGKNCIIQSCTAISGNFGLCENIDTSINRKSIVSRRACWNEVAQCIRDAGKDTVLAIMTQEGRIPADNDWTKDGDIYKDLYGWDRGNNKCPTTTEGTKGDVCITTKYSTDIAISDEMIKAKSGGQEQNTSYNYNHYLYDWCQTDLCNIVIENGNETIKCSENVFDWAVCRLTEQIWGNCETRPGNEKTPRNKIIINDTTGTNETLLSWFARNTNTDDELDSCRDTTCGYGFTNTAWGCIPADKVTKGDNLYCPEDSQPDEYTQIDTDDKGNTNCCSWHYYDSSIKTYDTGTDTIAGQERTTPIEENDKKLCCLYGAADNVQPYTNYAATNTAETNSIERSSICNP
ncbi:MAG: hypothetical protein II238_01450, partial [Alphaproteobacteria bacterium]|nr:hypothetical protein [Alphaproteobacteria bacterium]